MSRKPPLPNPTVVCPGWWLNKAAGIRVHDNEVLIKEGDPKIPKSHGICYDCLETFRHPTGPQWPTPVVSRSRSET